MAGEVLKKTSKKNLVVSDIKPYHEANNSSVNLA